MALFIDRQNIYMGARETFGLTNNFHTSGQTNPLKLGKLIADRVIDNTDRRLEAVRIYRGMPNARKQPGPNAAAMRQKSAWEKLDPDIVTVVTRPLRYPYNWPTKQEHEKGVDVQLAIDFVVGYLRREFDVGVLFTSDTDLLPALEATHEIVSTDHTTLLEPEVASWGDRSRSSGRRLRPKGLDLLCHWLGTLDLEQCKDDVDYNIRA